MHPLQDHQHRQDKVDHQHIHDQVERAHKESRFDIDEQQQQQRNADHRDQNAEGYIRIDLAEELSAQRRAVPRAVFLAQDVEDQQQEIEEQRREQRERCDQRICRFGIQPKLHAKDEQHCSADGRQQEQQHILDRDLVG